MDGVPPMTPTTSLVVLATALAATIFFVWREQREARRLDEELQRWREELMTLYARRREDEEKP